MFDLNGKACFTLAMMTLRDVLPHFEGKKKNLADALGITKQAISSWPLDSPIPEKQELKLRYQVFPALEINFKAA